MRMIKIHRFVVELSMLTFWYFEEFPVIILHICQDMVKAKKAFVSFKIVWNSNAFRSLTHFLTSQLRLHSLFCIILAHPFFHPECFFLPIWNIDIVFTTMVIDMLIISGDYALYIIIIYKYTCSLGFTCLPRIAFWIGGSVGYKIMAIWWFLNITERSMTIPSICVAVSIYLASIIVIGFVRTGAIWLQCH